jgi:hypothetical protein
VENFAKNMNLYLLANFFEADLQVGKSMIIFVQHERANVAFKGIVKMFLLLGWFRLLKTKIRKRKKLDFWQKNGLLISS